MARVSFFPRPGPAPSINELREALVPFMQGPFSTHSIPGGVELRGRWRNSDIPNIQQAIVDAPSPREQQNRSTLQEIWMRAIIVYLAQKESRTVADVRADFANILSNL